jgi:hypothetical protein
MRHLTPTLLALLVLVPATRADNPPAWVGPMKEVHAKFNKL